MRMAAIGSAIGSGGEDVDDDEEELNEDVDDQDEDFTDEQRCQQKLFTFRFRQWS